MNGLLIGRFQPFHLGHLEAIKFALSKVDKLWIGIGSSNKPIEKQNPFSADERKQMILSSINESILNRIQIFYIPDLANHEKWIDNIEKIVPKFEIVFSNDELTQFLYSKRGIKVFSVPFTNRDILSGTNIRDKIQSNQKWENLVPDGTNKILKELDANNRLNSL
ncbi:MAG TPA: nicotinamide-nucleotide adenylyltransferase [Nitrosopumilaceae archaeon]|nr:nicotinamide-nucleotide adenylyltransferase [Nitrosopumilaceae archaeon]